MVTSNCGRLRYAVIIFRDFWSRWNVLGVAILPTGLTCSNRAFCLPAFCCACGQLKDSNTIQMQKGSYLIYSNTVIFQKRMSSKFMHTSHVEKSRRPETISKVITSPIPIQTHFSGYPLLSTITQLRILLHINALVLSNSPIFYCFLHRDYIFT